MQEPKSKDPKYDDTAARRLLEEALMSSQMPETEEQVASAKELCGSLIQILTDVGLAPEPKALDARQSSPDSWTIAKHNGASINLMGAQIVIDTAQAAGQPKAVPVQLIWSTKDKRFEGKDVDPYVVQEQGKLRPRRTALAVLAEEILVQLGIVKRKPAPAPAPHGLPPG